jgi:RNA polymerase sigma factor (sigma-70 family)
MRVHPPPFEALIDAHAAELYRFLVASVGPAEAEDCLQETFMSAMRAYRRLRHTENLRGWLYTIAQRKATDAVRRVMRRPTQRLDEAASGSAPPPDPADDGLWLSVRALPPKQRAAVVHRYVFDRAYADIAEHMGTTPEAARQNVRAGLANLRKEIDRG